MTAAQDTMSNRIWQTNGFSHNGKKGAFIASHPSNVCECVFVCDFFLHIAYTVHVPIVSVIVFECDTLGRHATLSLNFFPSQWHNHHLHFNEYITLRLYHSCSKLICQPFQFIIAFYRAAIMVG